MTFVILAGFTYFSITSTAPTTINDFFLPGSQPGESGNLEDPGKCDNCHAGYDIDAEPFFGWRGSMMSQAARDPLFMATMSVANQDAAESGDLCLRCHTPEGWLAGRSTPTDGSALTAVDTENGISCDYCHSLVDPKAHYNNPYSGNADYANNTYGLDTTYINSLADAAPANSANGMHVVDNSTDKRGPYFDTDATHQTIYSPFHSSSDLCGTCHDVSNPVFSTVRDGSGNIIGYTPNTFDEAAPDFSPYEMFPIERTYSEWKMSAFNSPAGIPSDVFGGNKANVSSCQDCHMADTTGKGCNKNNARTRTDLPFHDMMGGNTWVPKILYDLYDNEDDTIALNAAVERAKYMLQNAAELTLNVDSINKQVTVTVTNNTGHKLPSGYPEGRRMWLNVKVWGNNGEIYESGHYDQETAYLTHDADAKIYEIKPGISPGLAAGLGLTAGPSFHFVLNDTIYSDNRIPPMGFTNAAFEEIQSPPVGYTYNDGQYWDETVYNLPIYPVAVKASLYYQTTSKEYIEFLRDENITDDWGDIMYGLWENHGKSPPELMVDQEWGAPIIDADEDGFIAAVDCNDNDENSYPGADEIYDCLDNNCNSLIDDVATSAHMLVWTGCAGNNDWNDPNNWNHDRTPLATDSVMITAAITSGTYPMLSGNINVHHLMIEESTNLQISAGSTLTITNTGTLASAGIVVNGQLINHGTITINSNSTSGLLVTTTGTLETDQNITINGYQQIGLEIYGIVNVLSGGSITVYKHGSDPIYAGVGGVLTIGGEVRVLDL